MIIKGPIIKCPSWTNLDWAKAAKDARSGRKVHTDLFKLRMKTPPRPKRRR